MLLHVNNDAKCPKNYRALSFPDNIIHTVEKITKNVSFFYTIASKTFRPFLARKFKCTSNKIGFISGKYYFWREISWDFLNDFQTLCFTEFKGGNVMLWLHFQHPKKPAKCNDPSDPSTVISFRFFATFAIANHRLCYRVSKQVLVGNFLKLLKVNSPNFT